MFPLVRSMPGIMPGARHGCRMILAEARRSPCHDPPTTVSSASTLIRCSVYVLVMSRQWTAEEHEIHRQAEARETARIIRQFKLEPLVKARGFRMVVACMPCGRETVTPVNDLLERRLSDVLLVDYVSRMSCQECGRFPSSVRLRHHVADWWLVGEREDRRS